MDFYIKKEDLETDIEFDIVVMDNDIVTDDSIVTSSLISIFTDGSQTQIGSLIDGGIQIGNKEYNINKLSQVNIIAYENGLKEALQWLLDDGICKDIEVYTEKEGNLLKVRITLTTDKENDLNLIYSLDQNLEILN